MFAASRAMTRELHLTGKFWKFLLIGNGAIQDLGKVLKEFGWEK